MKLFRLRSRTLALILIILPLLALFIYVAVRSGPLAPINVTVSTVKLESIRPSIFGIGTVQARYTYKIGPTYAGRVKRLDVHVGDTVKAGQILGQMDAVDLDDRIAAQEATIKSSEAATRQAEAKQVFAKSQANRYEKLYASRATSEESAFTKRHELSIANAALAASRTDTARLLAELKALRAQQQNLYLIAPVTGLVIARDVDPGTTVVAGQAVVELIDPSSLWIDTRFDQVSANGLKEKLLSKTSLRSRPDQAIASHVLRIEPRADQITEETLAKIVFDTTPNPLPPLGELAEVTVQLDALEATPSIPNAALRIVNGQRGVWKLQETGLQFVPVHLGRSDLNGQTQVLEGLHEGEQIIVYSEKVVSVKSRLNIVEHLPGVTP